MKNKTAVLLVVALVCGLGAAYLTSKVIADRAKPTQEEQVKVLVAKQTIQQYKVIREPEKLFTEKSFPKSAAPKGFISNFDDLKDRRLKVPLGQDKPVTVSDLLDNSGKGASLSGLIPDGYRAVGIKVTQDTTAGGFVLPGTKVDIVASLRRGDKYSSSQTILQDVLVLAVNNLYERNENQQSVAAHTVTVAVKPEDAQRLRLADQVSELSLALRPENEASSPALPVTRLNDVIKPAPGTEEEDPAGPGPKGKQPETVAGLPLPPLEQKKPVVEEEKFVKPQAEWEVTIRSGEKVKTQSFFRNKKGELVSGSDAKPVVHKEEKPVEKPQS